MPIAVSPPLATAVCGAVQEALNNVARHSGVMQASLQCRASGERVCLEVTDHGCGFEPSAVTGARYGVIRSIIARMRAAGGSAEVVSAPGAGTTIRLAWNRSRDVPLRDV